MAKEKKKDEKIPKEEKIRKRRNKKKGTGAICHKSDKIQDIEVIKKKKYWKEKLIRMPPGVRNVDELSLRNPPTLNDQSA